MYRSYVMQNGEEKYAEHANLKDAKNWVGYMIKFHDVKPIRIENTQTCEVMTNNLFNEWCVR